jgi:predicted membrane-bound mannosyltransferase
LRNLFEEIEDHLITSLNVIAPDEVDYAFNYGIVGGQDGQPRVMTVVVLRIRAVTLGEFIADAWFLDSPLPDYSAILEGVNESVKRLRNMRDIEVKNATEKASKTPDFPGAQGHNHDRLHPKMDAEGEIILPRP